MGISILAFLMIWVLFDRSQRGLKMRPKSCKNIDVIVDVIIRQNIGIEVIIRSQHYH